MKLKKTCLIITIISILGLGILFICKPNYWLKITNPLQYDIVSLDTNIDNKVLKLEFGVIINSDYFLDIILDSIEYQIKMDSIQFSQGKKVFLNNYKFSAKDTLLLPLTIELEKIQGIIQKNKDQDSINLRIDFKNYLKLPFTGNTIFEVKIERLIATPNPPKIKVLGIEKKSLSLHDAVYEIQFQIQNNSHHEINIKKIKATLDFPKLFTGHLNHQEVLILMPHSSLNTKAIIEIDNLDLVRDGLKILFQPKKKWDYNLQADLTIEKEDGRLLPIHITNDGRMPLKKKKP